MSGITILSKRAFAELFEDTSTRNKVFGAIYKTIEISFSEAWGSMTRAPTRDEIKRRFEILERWYRDLRGERKWSVDRVLQALPHALRCELIGNTYEPDDRALWIPKDGAP